jgi:hypothetical protein
MSMAEERGFEVVDKRRVSAEGPDAESPPESAAPTEETEASPEAGDAAGAESRAEGPAPGPEAPGAQAGDEEGLLPAVDAPGVVALCVNMLHEVAWVKLGLVPSPISQKIERDLAQARLAIDCAADLVRRLDPHLDADARRDLQNLISTLRMNFVTQSQR